ncbi:MAG: CGNR zinc finger domain-containing protein [Steroidobacteraceae bacterium]
MVTRPVDQTGRHYGPESFVGGVLALDFLNTVENWRGPVIEDRIPGFGDWVAWTRDAGLPAAARPAISRPAAAQFMRQLRTFRAEWRDLLRPVLAGAAVDAGLLRALNQRWQRAIAAREIRMTPAGARYDWRRSVPAWECAFHAVVLSAVELMTKSDQLVRVRECPGESCGWFFLDGSKNGSRHWCSMRTCGNADKVRRFRSARRET